MWVATGRRNLRAKGLLAWIAESYSFNFSLQVVRQSYLNLYWLALKRGKKAVGQLFISYAHQMYS